MTSPADSRTEMTWIALPSDCNAIGTVFGGQVCAWIDICAAVAAQRFARTNVVTAAMDQLVFKAPIRQGKVAVVRAMVNWAGRTSMEVGVRVEEEDPIAGVRTHTSTAYLTFVSVGPDQRPRQLRELVPKSEEEQRRWREAQARRADRLSHRERILQSRKDDDG